MMLQRAYGICNAHPHGTAFADVSESASKRHMTDGVMLGHK
jgi:hypothetical protein